LRRSSAILLLLITGIIWSTGGFLIKLIPWSPIAIAGVRSGFTSVVIYFFDRPKSYLFSKYTWAGALFYTLMVICFVLGNKMTTAGNVILIQYAAPIYVALFSFYFLGEKSTKIDWIAIFLIFLGLGFFFIEELSMNQLNGKIMAILSGIGFAGLTICMRKEKNDSPIHSVLIGNIITFIICCPGYLSGITSTLHSWLIIAFLGVVQLGIAYILYSTAIKHVSALDAIIYPVIEPIFNPVFAFIILGESMSIFGIMGGFLVLLGVVARGFIKKSSKSWF